MSHSVTCDACNAVFSIPDEIWEKRISGQKATLKCRHCKATIEIDDRVRRSSSVDRLGRGGPVTGTLGKLGTPAPADAQGKESVGQTGIVSPNVSQPTGALGKTATKPEVKPSTGGVQPALRQSETKSDEVHEAARPLASKGTPLATLSKQAAPGAGPSAAALKPPGPSGALSATANKPNSAIAHPAATMPKPASPIATHGTTAGKPIPGTSAAQTTAIKAIPTAAAAGLPNKVGTTPAASSTAAFRQTATAATLSASTRQPQPAPVVNTSTTAAQPLPLATASTAASPQIAAKTPLNHGQSTTHAGRDASSAPSAATATSLPAAKSAPQQSPKAESKPSAAPELSKPTVRDTESAGSAGRGPPPLPKEPVPAREPPPLPRQTQTESPMAELMARDASRSDEAAPRAHSPASMPVLAAPNVPFSARPISIAPRPSDIAALGKIRPKFPKWAPFAVLGGLVVLVSLFAGLSWLRNDTAEAKAKPVAAQPIVPVQPSPPPKSTPVIASASEPAPPSGSSLGAGFSSQFAEAAAKQKSTTKFDKAATLNALAIGFAKASSCKHKGEPEGVATTTISVAPSGQVLSVTVAPPFTTTFTAECISKTLLQCRVPPFEGAPVRLVHPISVR